LKLMKSKKKKKMGKRVLPLLPGFAV